LSYLHNSESSIQLVFTLCQLSLNFYFS
jgi:hypothetical protein